ncbi:hypothetical protein KQX54_000814 [Cotesia glomerata]|uniref:DDE-1 domain-containing protein n=1 Tax=Cotesia glomerata TaxID=32391 RepID=A0AAV7I0H9_COTGL|nr:hypothetical protein KQX54_000814 [Cotesia glomerata]
MLKNKKLYNCDESSILLCPDAESVLAGKGTQAVYTVVDGGKEALTVLFMYSAEGVRAPPMIMYSYKKNIPKKLLRILQLAGVLEFQWLVQENTKFPVILYMDNHSSHLNLPLVTFRREKQIELIMLPPNSTHIMVKNRSKDSKLMTQNIPMRLLKKKFLQLFEKNLPEELVSDFKEAAINGSWTGDIEKKALFDYWFGIDKKSTGI